MHWELMAVQGQSCGQMAKEQPPVFSGLVVRFHQLQPHERCVLVLSFLLFPQPALTAWFSVLLVLCFFFPMEKTNAFLISSKSGECVNVALALGFITPAF